jgi:hypothetical protein
MNAETDIPISFSADGSACVYESCRRECRVVRTGMAVEKLVFRTNDVRSGDRKVYSPMSYATWLQRERMLRIRSIFPHCKQAGATDEREAPGSGQHQVPQRVQALRNAADKRIHHRTLLEPIRDDCAFLHTGSRRDGLSGGSGRGAAAEWERCCLRGIAESSSITHHCRRRSGG